MLLVNAGRLKAGKPFAPLVYPAYAADRRRPIPRFCWREAGIWLAANGSFLAMCCAVPRLLLVLFVFSLEGNSQWLSVGVAGGGPVSTQSATYGSATLRLNPSSSDQATNDVTFQAPNDFYQKPYAIGPTVELVFPGIFRWKPECFMGDFTRT
jgi:hypothetical protein